MAHLTEDDLVLHYYGELAGADEQRLAAHLASCTACRREFTSLQRALRLVDEADLTPDAPDDFAQTVWARLVPDLRRDQRKKFSWFVLSPVPLALAAAVLVLVGAAFLAGRLSSPHRGAVVNTDVSAEQVRERILLVDLGEHLDRSQMILVELVSAAREGAVDVSRERESAEQLLRANRLYRETAAATGETAIGDLLDELERVLVELAAGPEQLSSADLEAVQAQIDGKGLLFRVRVVSSEIRNRQDEAIRQRTIVRTSTGV